MENRLIFLYRYILRWGDIEAKDIPTDPGSMENLGELRGAVEKFTDLNASLRKDGETISKGIGNFQKQYVAFKKARAGARAYRKFADFLTSDDAMKDLQAAKGLLETQLDAAIKKIEDGQKRLEEYGNKMAKAANQQKQKKIEERDKHLKRIDDDKNLSDGEKAKKKETYELLKKQRDKLDGQRTSLEAYHDGLVETKKTKVEVELTEDEKRKEQLDFYNSYLEHSVQGIDKLLEDPRLGKVLVQQLQQTRAQFVKKQKGGQLATIQMDARISGGTEIWDKLTKEEQAVAENTSKIDSHIKNDIVPTMAQLSGHINILDEAMLQFTDSKKEVMDHYKKAFKGYDQVDAAVDNAVLQQSLANTQMIGQLNKQKTALGSMTLESTSFYQATIGAAFGTIGGAVTGVANEMIESSEFIDHELTLSREAGIHPARYWSSKIALEILSTPVGAL